MYGGLALIVGGGNVGVGVMLRLLRNAGYDVAMVTHRAAQARQLRVQGARLQLTGAARGRLQLAPCAAVAAGESRCVTDLVRVASLVVVAVRPHQLGEVAALLAPGLARRRRPVNVLVCDNGPCAGSRLARELTGAHGEANTERHGRAPHRHPAAISSRGRGRGSIHRHALSPIAHSRDLAART